MTKLEINSIFTMMSLMNQNFYIKNNYIYFKKFNDLKQFFVIYNKLTGYEEVVHHDNIFNFKFISQQEGILNVLSYCLDNPYRSGWFNNDDEDYLILTLSNGLYKYNIKIKPYSKVFVKKIK